MRTLIGGVVLTGLMAPAVLAQAPAASNELPDRFQIDTGYFRISANTVLNFNAPGAGNDVSFEKDLGVAPDANTFWLDATWRVGRRHQLKLGYTRLNREQPSHTLEARLRVERRDLQQRALHEHDDGGDILGGYYRFALLRNERFEIGPSARHRLSLGAGHHPGTGTITGPGGVPVSRDLDTTASTGSITGAVGRLRERLAYAAPGLAGRLPLHQGQPRRQRGLGQRLAAGRGLLLLQERGPGRAVQVQQVPLRARTPREQAGRRGHLRRLSGVLVVPVLAAG